MQNTFSSMQASLSPLCTGGAQVSLGGPIHERDKLCWPLSRVFACAWVATARLMPKRLAHKNIPV